MKTPKRYTITAALPYANGPLHIGHVAGAYLPADIYARYLRQRGKDVIFICGSDEHGAAITIRAKQEGITPKEIVDKYDGLINEAFQRLGVSFDIYHRTSSPLHHETAQDFFKDLYNKGVFVEKESEQYYDEEFNQFLADRYIKGTCPKCDSEGAYGDQCEKCGSDLSPMDLKNPISVLSGKPPTIRTTKHWFLPLNKDEEWLNEWINEGKLDGVPHHDASLWKKNVMGQVNSWLNEGLHPRAITRDLDWGVDVPQEIEGAEGKKLYVWLDAPIGYISATKQLAESGKIDNWEQYWKDEETALIHFIGKDNIVFHSIIFPSILKAKGDFILPQNVPANEFMNLEGDKISTSRNWAVWVHEFLQDNPEKVDELRYVLASNIPESKDSEFTWEDFQTRINSELVATLGNFVNRIFVLNQKYYDGVVSNDVNSFAGLEAEVQAVFSDKKGKIETLIEQYRFREALEVYMSIARAANKFLTDYEPWKLVKTDEAKTKAVLFACTQIVATLGILAEPFLPNTSQKVKRLLNVEEWDWDDACTLDIVEVGHHLGEAQLLFQKIDAEFVAAQITKLEASKVANESNDAKEEKPSFAPIKEEIQFDDFAKMDIRIGTITEAQKVKKADRLLQLTVDMGFEVRTIISGIAEHFAPEDVVDMQVPVLCNLAPRKMRGVLSQGMILFAENSEGKLIFVSPKEAMENGGGVA
ncbi:MAG: methionine--tRNA ligase [Chitinophagales bacterium]